MHLRDVLGLLKQFLLGVHQPLLPHGLLRHGLQRVVAQRHRQAGGHAGRRTIEGGGQVGPAGVLRGEGQPLGVLAVQFLPALGAFLVRGAFAAQQAQFGFGQEFLGGLAFAFQPSGPEGDAVQVLHGAAANDLQFPAGLGAGQRNAEFVPSGVHVLQQCLGIGPGVQRLDLHRLAQVTARVGDVQVRHGLPVIQVAREVLQAGLVLGLHGLTGLPHLVELPFHRVVPGEQAAQRVQFTQVRGQAQAHFLACLRGVLTVTARLDDALYAGRPAAQQNADLPEKRFQQREGREVQDQLHAQREHHQRQQGGQVSQHVRQRADHQRGQPARCVRLEHLVQRQQRQHHHDAAQHPPREVAQAAPQEHQHAVSDGNDGQQVSAPAQPPDQHGPRGRHEPDGLRRAGTPLLGHAGAEHRHGQQNPHREQHQPQGLTVEAARLWGKSSSFCRLSHAAKSNLKAT